MNRCAICGRLYSPLSPEEFRRRHQENPDLGIASIFCDDCLKARAEAMTKIRGSPLHYVLNQSEEM